MNKNYLFLKSICGASIIILVLIACLPTVISQYSTYASLNKTEVSKNSTASDSSANFILLSDEKITINSSNLPLYDKYTVPERKSLNLDQNLPPVKPYYGERTVYLTFDDGPEPENTPAILDILKEYNIKATFFVVGTQVEKYPEILKRIFSEGHAIGNHSYNHIYRDLYKSSMTYLNQLYQTDDKIKNIIGFRPRISRAPGGSAGSFTKEYWNALEHNGYVEVGWNISSGDASSAKASQITANIARQLEQQHLWSHSIVLMHDGRGHNETVSALPNIIKLYKDKGFEFRVVSIETPPAW
ncbi:polysaccharide deacetylase family protein [Dendrosporobacter sp. 1207_IL3150]|uniref:polysaccharide deacetylase family protein n=1 Tax=Dendrosporobacter sp. 1207_IL3150 TaxID=3084054 RepID=UPI002FD98004